MRKGWLERSRARGDWWRCMVGLSLLLVIVVTFWWVFPLLDNCGSRPGYDVWAGQQGWWPFPGGEWFSWGKECP